MTSEEKEIIIDVCNDFETEGCDGCGTVSVEAMNKLRALVGWDSLEGDIE